MALSELFPTQSAYVSQFYANQSFTAPSNLFFGQYQGVGDIYRSLIQFPLHSAPLGRIISSAQLELPISRNEIPVGTVINAGLQYALAPWSQLSVTWNNQPSFNLANSFTVSSANLPGSVISIDVTSIVISWINGSIANHGFVITGNELLNSLVGIANTELVVPLPIIIPGEHRDRCRHRHRKHRHHKRCQHKHKHRPDMDLDLDLDLELDLDFGLGLDLDCDREIDLDIDRNCCRDFDWEFEREGIRRLDVIGTSIAVQNPPDSLHFVVVHDTSSVGPKLIINFI